MTGKLLGYLILFSRFLLSFGLIDKFVKNTPFRVVFSTLLSVFRNVIKHGLLCVTYSHFNYKTVFFVTAFVSG